MDFTAVIDMTLRGDYRHIVDHFRGRGIACRTYRCCHHCTV